ncbi:hypothetical protein D046_1284A, partial [Vibrio parahaemolyticus V-223/04]
MFSHVDAQRHHQIERHTNASQRFRRKR